MDHHRACCGVISVTVGFYNNECSLLNLVRPTVGLSEEFRYCTTVSRA